jgi:hypothetical protein
MRFQGWNNYSELSFLFPNPSLIFKENLNRQRGASNPPGRSLKMAFKVFNNQDEV